MILYKLEKTPTSYIYTFRSQKLFRFYLLVILLFVLAYLVFLSLEQGIPAVISVSLAGVMSLLWFLGDHLPLIIRTMSANMRNKRVNTDMKTTGLWWKKDGNFTWKVEIER